MNMRVLSSSDSSSISEELELISRREHERRPLSIELHTPQFMLFIESS